MLFGGLGRGCCKQSPFEETIKVPLAVTFPWLSHGRLSSTELLLGKEETSLPPAEEETMSRMRGMSLPVGSVVCAE